MTDVLDLAIVIVNYNTKHHLGNCLASLFRHPLNARFKVFVVDNCSTDESAEMVEALYPEVILTRNRHNVGFAKANNQILRNTEETRYYLLLNPDIIVSEGSLDKLRVFMDTHDEVGIAGCKLLHPDASLQYSCRSWPHPLTILARGLMIERLFPNARMFRRYLMKNWDHNALAEVDWVLGSCMIIRRAALLNTGYFDENFFMYYEDVDLCLRMRKNRWKVYYVPEPVMVHHHIQESHKLTSLRVRIYHIQSALYFFHKHGRFASLLVGGAELQNYFRIIE